MKHINDRFRRGARALRGFATLLVALATSLPAMAGPGAHGPNGEHLDAAGQTVGGVSAGPRTETRSEAFELVARLDGQELSIMIDRYDTNAPVLNAKVEVESGPLKAIAAFHADHGDYSITDPALLKALSTPGRHALVFTVILDKESDLLDATLVVDAATPTSEGGGRALPASGTLWTAIGVLCFGAAALAWRRRSRTRGLSLTMEGKS